MNEEFINAIKHDIASGNTGPDFLETINNPEIVASLEQLGINKGDLKELTSNIDLKQEKMCSIFERQGLNMSAEEIANMNVFLKTARDEDLDIQAFVVNMECNQYMNKTTGERYIVENGKLNKQVSTKEDLGTPSINNEDYLSNAEVLENLNRISYYNDEELQEIVKNPNLDEDTRNQVKGLISTPKNEEGEYVKINAPVKVLTRTEPPRAAFVNVLILSLISFFFSVMTVLIILVKMQG